MTRYTCQTKAIGYRRDGVPIKRVAYGYDQPIGLYYEEYDFDELPVYDVSEHADGLDGIALYGFLTESCDAEDLNTTHLQKIVKGEQI